MNVQVGITLHHFLSTVLVPNRIFSVSLQIKKEKVSNQVESCVLVPECQVAIPCMLN